MAAKDSGVIRGVMMHDHLNIGKVAFEAAAPQPRAKAMDSAPAAKKPTVLSQETLRAMYIAHAAGSKKVVADSGIGAHMVTPEEEARNQQICNQQGLSGANYPTTGANNDSAIDTYFGNIRAGEGHTSMDDVFRDPDAKSFDDYFK